MSDASVIKEFLVALGFKVDEAGFKKFTKGIASATKVAASLSTELVAVAAAAEAVVAKVSSRFEDLYYASQRIGSTVENIRGVGFAIGQMGGAAAGGRQALESLAEFLRSNPGGEGFIAGIGVQTRQTNGQMRDMSDILEDLGAQFRQMPYYAAKVRAGILGIDPNTLQALIRGTDEYRRRFRDMAREVGVDQQAAAAAGHGFMNDVRDLLTYLQLLGEKFILMAQGPAKRIIDFMRDLNAATHGAALAIAVLGGGVSALLALFGPVVVGIGAIAAAIGLLIDDFVVWRQAGKSLIDWGAWAPEIDNAIAAIGNLVLAFGDLLGAFGPTAKALASLFGPALTGIAHFALRLVTDVINTVADLVHLVDDFLNRRWAKVYQDAGKAMHEGANLFDKQSGGPSADARADAQKRAQGATPGPWSTPQTGPKGLRNNNPGNLRSWGDAPIKNGFAVFKSAQEGLSAMAGNLLAYSRHGLDTVKAIVSRWAPASENNTAAYISAVAKQIGAGASDHLNLRNPEVLAKLMAAITQHENGANPYGRDMMLAVANARLGTGSPAGVAKSSQSVVLNQKTEIHVSGAGAAETGKLVVGAQDRVNGDMVRTAQGGLR